MTILNLLVNVRRGHSEQTGTIVDFRHIGLVSHVAFLILQASTGLISHYSMIIIQLIICFDVFRRPIPRWTIRTPPLRSPIIHPSKDERAYRLKRWAWRFPAYPFYITNYQWRVRNMNKNLRLKMRTIRGDLSTSNTKMKLFLRN